MKNCIHNTHEVKLKISKNSLVVVIIQCSSFVFFGLTGELFTKGILLAIQISGFLLSLWGILTMKIGNFNIQPEVKPTAVFVSHGPYKVIRNPMYSGLILFFGVSVSGDFSYLRLGVLVVLIIVLLLKIFMEEQFLEERFEKKYTEYKKKTHRLIPFVY